MGKTAKTKKDLLKSAGSTPPAKVIKKKAANQKEKSPIAEKSISKKKQKKRFAENYPSYSHFIFKVLKETHHDLSVNC